MEYPDFDISHWYAEQRAHELGLTDKIMHHRCMGEVISMVATKLLTDGIASSYPSMDYNLKLEQHFQVLRVNVRSPGYFLIKDFYLEKDTDLPKSWLEDPEFDLVGWYRCYIDQNSLFEQKYCNAHPELLGINSSADAEQPEDGKPLVLSPTPKQEAEWDDLPELETLSANEFDVEEFFEENSKMDAVYDDMPPLDPLSDDSDLDEDEYVMPQLHPTYCQEDDCTLIDKVQMVFTQCQPYPGDGKPVNLSFKLGNPRFIIER